MTQNNGYHFKNLIVLRYEWGLAVYAGTEWHILSDTILSRSIIVEHNVLNGDLYTVIFPLLRNRIGPFLDWLNKLTGSLIEVNHTKKEIEQLEVSIESVNPCFKKIVSDNRIFSFFTILNEKNIVLPFVILSASSIYFINSHFDVRDLIKRAICTSTHAGFINDTQIVLSSNAISPQLSIRSEKLQSYFEWLSKYVNSNIKDVNFVIHKDGINKINTSSSSSDDGELLVSPFIGPIRFCTVTEKNSLYYALADASSKDIEHSSIETFVTAGAGAVKHTKKEASKISKFEAWERYSLQSPDDNEKHIYSYNDLVPEVRRYLNNNLYSKEQYRLSGFPYCQVQSNMSLHCTEVNDAKSHNIVAMPVDLIWLTNYDKIVQSTSNGAATYITEDKAAIRGLFELIERHVFLKIWHSNYPTTRYQIDSLPREARKLISVISTNYDISVNVVPFNISITNLYISFATVRAKNNQDSPSCIIGGGADISIIQSIINAIEECLRGIDYYNVAFSTILDSESNYPKLIHGPLDHISWHWFSGRQRYSNFIFKQPIKKFPNKVNWLDIESFNDFTEVARAVTKQIGGTIWYKNITPYDHRQNMPVVRVIASNLLPLYFGPHLVRNTLKTEKNIKWNTPPHPFP